MENVLRPLIVIGGSVVLTLIVGWAADRLMRKADERHGETPLWGLLRRGRIPFQLVLCAALLRGSYDQAHILDSHKVGVGRTLTLVLIGSAAWLAVRVAAAIVESSFSRYAHAHRDPARVRRVRTQVTLIMRVVAAVVGVVAVAAMLLTFPAMRAAGASLLASAGIIAAIAGVAAQSTLSNLFAGLQIAFGDTVRLGDVVVVDGEWGTIDEITLTHLTVRTWDERRITMPVSYFTSKPFENWSRGGSQMTGTVFLHVDHSTPIPEMREKLRDILRRCPAWDGRAWDLSVTDSTPNTMQVRALVTAKDPDDIWTVRVTVREQLMAWLADDHPHALPRVNTADAVLPPRDADGTPRSPNGEAHSAGSPNGAARGAGSPNGEAHSAEGDRRNGEQKSSPDGEVPKSRNRRAYQPPPH